MHDHRNTELLTLQSADLTQRTPFCVDDQQIAEYYDGLLPDGKRARVERHVTDCRFCIARIGMLARLDHAAEERVPEDALAAAKLTARPATRIRHRRPAWAAAALVVMAAGLSFQLFNDRQPGLESGSPAVVSAPSSTIRETRSIDDAAFGPSILSPRDGQPAGADTMILWTAVPDSLFYRVRIVSDEGDLMWQERIEGTEWQLPESLMLAAGADYYLRIDAFVTDAKSLQSDYVLFRFGEDG
jgi:hypothetical protein